MPRTQSSMEDLCSELDGDLSDGYPLSTAGGTAMGGRSHIGEQTPLLRSRWRFRNRMLCLAFLVIGMVAALSVISARAAMVKHAGELDLPRNPHGSPALRKAALSSTREKRHVNRPGHNRVVKPKKLKIVTKKDKLMSDPERAKLIRAMTAMLRQHESEEQVLRKLLPLVRVFATRDRSLKLLLKDMSSMWKEAEASAATLSVKRGSNKSSKVSAAQAAAQQARRKRMGRIRKQTENMIKAAMRQHQTVKRVKHASIHRHSKPNFEDFKDSLSNKESIKELWEQTTAKALDTLRRAATKMNQIKRVDTNNQTPQQSTAHHKSAAFKRELSEAQQIEKAEDHEQQQAATKEEDKILPFHIGLGRSRARSLHIHQVGTSDSEELPSTSQHLLSGAQKAIGKWEHRGAA